MLVKVDQQLEDVARTVGATEVRSKLDITIPLIRNELLVGWLVMFIIFVREYSPGLYLLGPGTEVIGSLLVSLWSKGANDLVSALSVVNVIIIGAGVIRRHQAWNSASRRWPSLSSAISCAVSLPRPCGNPARRL
jgi:iron(III) transport system permease protein